MARKAFKYRLYPTKKQEQVLFWTLARCRELYNAALSEYKDAYKPYQRVSVLVNAETNTVMATTMVTNRRVRAVSYYEQKRDLVEIKDLREEYQAIHSQVLQDVLLRLKRASMASAGGLSMGRTQAFPASRGATAMIASPILKLEGSPSRMIIGCASQKSAPSRSKCIARWKAPQKPVPSSTKRGSGTPCSPAR